MKTVLITGAAGGIGEAICEIFAKDGYNLALHYSSSGKKAGEIAERLESKFGVKAEIFGADFTGDEEVKALAEKVLSHFGKIDILVNNAGPAEKRKNSSKISRFFACSASARVAGSWMAW